MPNKQIDQELKNIATKMGQIIKNNTIFASIAYVQSEINACEDIEIKQTYLGIKEGLIELLVRKIAEINERSLKKQMKEHKCSRLDYPFCAEQTSTILKNLLEGSEDIIGDFRIFMALFSVARTPRRKTSVQEIKIGSEEGLIGELHIKISYKEIIPQNTQDKTILKA